MRPPKKPPEPHDDRHPALRAARRWGEPAGQDLRDHRPGPQVLLRAGLLGACRVPEDHRHHPGKETSDSNQLTVLSQATGTSATGLAEFAQQIAPVARQVGTTQTEVQGLAAAFYEAGQDGYQASNF